MEGVAALSHSRRNDLEAHQSASALYDKQSLNWVRDKPTCLSDFTGRPRVVAAVEDVLSKGDATVLDVGCGEGYMSRTFMAMGARKVIGIDISEEMIARANLQDTVDQTNIVLGAAFEVGFCDLAVAVFLFNYMTIHDMTSCMSDVFSALKPGGTFVFSVPHPAIIQFTTDTFGFKGEAGDQNRYFSLRDQVISGHIKKTDGTVLNVRMVFKTLDDYFKALSTIGFEIVTCEEARVKPEHMASNPSFFASVSDAPLHLVFKV
ncbi:hypothetical protein GUITHDRAFT_78048, partial [Guillardia theta CCMP2712]